MVVLDLEIGGMTCASCAAHIERKLNKLDGVTAQVNYATERAHIEAPAGATAEQLITEVEKTGYTATERISTAQFAASPAESANTPLVTGTSTASETNPATNPIASQAARTPPVTSPRPTVSAADTQLAQLRQRLIISAWLTAPVIAMAMIPALQFQYWQWLSLTLAAPVVVWGGYPFHRAAIKNLRYGTATMDTLISLGTAAAFIWSLYALFFGHAGMPGMTHGFDFQLSFDPQHSDGAGNIYLEAAAGVTTFVLAGRYFETRAKRQAGAAVRALLTLGAQQVSVLRGTEPNQTETVISIDQLHVGDVFVVRPGEKIATDGVVVSGESAVDQSMLTGEAVPVDVGTGAEVTGGTVSTSGRLMVRANRVGADTQLAHMARMVEQAQTGKANIQRLADRVSRVFVPIVIGIAVVTFAGWLIAGFAASFAFTAAVAVLIIACPCALGLATPTALLVGTGRAAQLGVLIKGPEVLEQTRKATTIVLDKTGTITSGQMQLSDLIPAAGVELSELTRFAGSLEHASEHPIARAIAAGAARQLNISVDGLAEVTEFTNLPGMGVTGFVAGEFVVAGNLRLMESQLADWQRTSATEQLLRQQAELEQAGKTVVVLAWANQIRGIAAVTDTVRPTSAAAIQQLRELGLKPIMVTGDSSVVSKQVAREVGIDEVISRVLPEQKASIIRDLQAAGNVVAMVGDGVNDSVALATADLGMAMGTGSDAAIEAADITLVSSDLRSTADAIHISRRTLSTIKSNLFWAFGYNVAAIPLAAFGLLNPMLAGAAMALSSVCVVANSLRLRGVRSLRN